MAPSTSPNPLDDGQLQSLLQELEGIESRRQFLLWRMSFLKRFHEFLSDDGTKKAEKVYKRFRSSALKPLILHLQRLRSHFCKHELTTERCTVRARQTVSNLQSIIVTVTQKLQGLLPTTLDVERECGYSKFHMGALLIRDGFTEYARLTLAEEIFSHLKTTPAIITHCDRQFLKDMDYYCESLGIFIGILADLGLKMPIEKSRDFMDETDEDIMTVFDEEPGYLEDCSLSSVDEDEETQLVALPPQLQAEPLQAEPSDSIPSQLQAESPPTDSPTELSGELVLVPSTSLVSEAPLAQAQPRTVTSLTGNANVRSSTPASPVKERGYTRLSDYYHGASDPRSWRIADQIKKEKHDKEQKQTEAKPTSIPQPLSLEDETPNALVVSKEGQDLDLALELDVTDSASQELVHTIRDGTDVDDSRDGERAKSHSEEPYPEAFIAVERLKQPDELIAEELPVVPHLDENVLLLPSVMDLDAVITGGRIAGHIKQPTMEEHPHVDLPSYPMPHTTKECFERQTATSDSYPSPHTTKEFVQRRTPKRSTQPVKKETEHVPPKTSESSDQTRTNPVDAKRVEAPIVIDAEVRSESPAKRTTPKSSMKTPKSKSPKVKHCLDEETVADSKESSQTSPSRSIGPAPNDGKGGNFEPGSCEPYPDAFVTREVVTRQKKASKGEEVTPSDWPRRAENGVFSPPPAGADAPEQVPPRSMTKGDPLLKTNKRSEPKRKFWFFKRPTKRVQPPRSKGSKDEESQQISPAKGSPTTESPRNHAHAQTNSSQKATAKPKEQETLKAPNSEAGDTRKLKETVTDDSSAHQDEVPLKDSADQAKVKQPLKKGTANKVKEKPKARSATNLGGNQPSETQHTVSDKKGQSDKETIDHSKPGAGALCQPNKEDTQPSGKHSFFQFLNRRSDTDDLGSEVKENEDHVPAAPTKAASSKPPPPPAERIKSPPCDSNEKAAVSPDPQSRNSGKFDNTPCESSVKKIDSNSQHESKENVEVGKVPVGKPQLFQSFRKKKEHQDLPNKSETKESPVEDLGMGGAQENVDEGKAQIEKKPIFQSFRKKKEHQDVPLKSESKESPVEDLGMGGAQENVEEGKAQIEKKPIFQSFRKKKEHQDVPLKSESKESPVEDLGMGGAQENVDEGKAQIEKKPIFQSFRKKKEHQDVPLKSESKESPDEDLGMDGAQENVDEGKAHIEKKPLFQSFRKKKEHQDVPLKSESKESPVEDLGMGGAQENVDEGKAQIEKKPLFQSFRKKKEHQDECVAPNVPMKSETKEELPDDPSAGSAPTMEKRLFLSSQEEKGKDDDSLHDRLQAPGKEQSAQVTQSQMTEKRPFFSFKKKNSPEKERLLQEAPMADLPSCSTADRADAPSVQTSRAQLGANENKVAGTLDKGHINPVKSSENLAWQDHSCLTDKVVEKQNTDSVPVPVSSDADAVASSMTQHSAQSAKENNPDGSNSGSKPTKRSLWPFQREKKQDTNLDEDRSYPPLNLEAAKHSLDRPIHDTEQSMRTPELNASSVQDGTEHSSSKLAYPDLHAATARESLGSPGGWTQVYPDIIGEQIHSKANILQDSVGALSVGLLSLAQSENDDLGCSEPILQLTNGEDMSNSSSAMVVFDKSCSIEMANGEDILNPSTSMVVFDKNCAVEEANGVDFLNSSTSMVVFDKSCAVDEAKGEDVLNSSTSLVVIDSNGSTDEANGTCKQEERHDKKRKKAKVAKPTTAGMDTNVAMPSVGERLPSETDNKVMAPQKSAETIEPESSKITIAPASLMTEAVPEEEMKMTSKSSSVPVPSGGASTSEPSIESVCTNIKPRAPANLRKELTAERRKKCYMWYARLGQPNKVEMKKRVAALPESCDITQDEVDALPWVGGGICLSVKAMNELFLNPEDAE